MPEPTTEQYAATYGVPVEIILRAEVIARETGLAGLKAIEQAIREKQQEPPIGIQLVERWDDE